MPRLRIPRALRRNDLRSRIGSSCAREFWNEGDWSIPIHFELTKLIHIAGQPVSIGPTLRYWAAATDGDAHNWGWRFTATLLFPDK